MLSPIHPSIHPSLAIHPDQAILVLKIHHVSKTAVLSIEKILLDCRISKQMFVSCMQLECPIKKIFDAAELPRNVRNCSEKLGAPPAKIWFPSWAVGVKRRLGPAVNKSLELSSTALCCMSISVQDLLHLNLDKVSTSLQVICLPLLNEQSWLASVQRPLPAVPPHD